MRTWAVVLIFLFTSGGIILYIAAKHALCLEKGGVLVSSVPKYVCIKAEVLR